MAGQVFISHSSQNKPVARRIAAALEENGLRVWLDENSIRLGSSIGSEVAAGIDSADYFLLLVSGASVQSRWVHKEAELAFQKSIETKFPIIPVMLDKTPVPKILKDVRSVDFSHSFDRGIEELLAFFKLERRSVTDNRRFPLPDPPASTKKEPCPACLSKLSMRMLREKVSGHFARPEIEVMWYDIFETDANNELGNIPLANLVIQLIENCKRRRKLTELFEVLCDQRPDIC